MLGFGGALQLDAQLPRLLFQDAFAPRDFTHVAHLQQARWEWLLIVPVFFFSNLFEWWIHKYVMHRLIDVWALRAIYDRHTRQHHQYFTDNEWTIDTTREFRIVFFPWRLLFVLGVPTGLVTWAIVREIMPAVTTLQAAIGQFLDPRGDHAGPFARWLAQYVDLEQTQGATLHDHARREPDGPEDRDLVTD